MDQTERKPKPYLVLSLAALAALLLLIGILAAENAVLLTRSSSVVGRIPKTLLQSPAGGTVLPGRKDILILGDTPPTARTTGALGRETRTVLLSVSGDECKTVFETASSSGPRTAQPMSESISPNGRKLLFRFGRHFAPLGMADTRSGRILWETPGPTGIEYAWRPFSGDGRQFLAKWYGAGSCQLWLFDSRTGKPVKCVAKARNPKRALFAAYGFVPGRNRIQYVELGDPDTLYSVNTDGSNRKLLGHLSPWDTPSPDGSTFIGESCGRTHLGMGRVTPGSVVLKSASGKELKNLYDLAENYGLVESAWSPNGKLASLVIRPWEPKRLFFGKRKARSFVTVIDVSTGASVAELKDPKHDVLLLDWYPDSSAVLCMTETKTHFLVHRLPVR